MKTLYGPESESGQDDSEDGPPSMGKQADRFLSAFGLQLGSRWIIYQAYTKNDRTEFVKELNDRGMAQLEAEWIWDDLLNI